MREGLPARAGRAALVACAAGLAAAPGALAAPAGRKPIAAAGPQVTLDAVDQGAAAKTAPQSLRVYLAPNGGEDALKQAVADVSTPGSPTYGHFLTPDQFRAKYAPSGATIKAVKHWLKAQGLQPAGAEASGRYITATGTAAAAEAAFATTLHEFTKGDETFQAPTATPTVPDAVASSILAVSGLATADKMMKPLQSFPPPAAYVNARPCSTSYGSTPGTFQADAQTPLPLLEGATVPYSLCGYEPGQLRSAYEGGTTFTGAGQTVGIVDAYASPTIEADANTYATRHGDAAFAAGQLSQVTPNDFTHGTECDASGWYGEETLDVEAVHAMAPGANVRYYGAQSCDDSDLADALDTVVDDNAVSIVSSSWGGPESTEALEDVVADEQAFQQGALQGITFFFSSGDNGDELANTGLLQADYPASDPYVTSVGGTSTGIGADGALSFLTGWGTQKYALSDDGKSWTPQGFVDGSGGGYSRLFKRPDYQSGIIAPRSPAGRAYPDVAMDADPTTGMLVGETQQFPTGAAYGEHRVGGTSLAAPLMAAMQALTQQRAGGRMGFINPALYQAGNGQSGQFLDVTGPGPDAGNVRADYVNGLDPSGGIVYSVRTFDQDSSLVVTPGWDDVTGLGVPSPNYINAFGG
ncbi:S53 family peptidase [Solirubrobacter ginsenosidimutans]|uniref:S53 family peptidase n=1 Tax=Solirubrobacter ginsenosidimutans TaxID=490573 RepID=A0A9X3N2N5_9ACTN|nr:S53 family peptidase [Solirubrobacter ginsenosidimutans]MDA0166151.1 S53 family peptidase [Solirubrobacter ginsenosidimutans]